MPTISKNIVSHFENKEIVLCKIENNFGAFIEVLNFGATLVSVIIPNKQGEKINRILRYNDIESYFTDKFYLGTTIGRVANRISGAKFNLADSTYFLDKNDGKNSNHGGFSGLNNKVFDYEILPDKVIFLAKSQDGESGFPGNLEIQVAYSFTDNNEVIIDFDVKSDKLTPISLTNHAYFNLSGKKSEAVNHLLKVHSKKYLEFDKNFLPTGRIFKIKNSYSYNFFDFEKIQQKMCSKNETYIQGFNTYFIAEDDSKNELKLLAELKDDESEILLQVKSTMPGVQFYTGDYLSDDFSPFSGVCLEAQYYPDYLNHANFPTSFVKKGETWKEKIVYTFTTF